MPVYTTISIELPLWLRKSMESIIKGFLWAGSKAVHGGKCLMAWARVQRPLHLGGMGVVDITLLGRALQTHWLWLRRTDPTRSWTGLPCQADSVTEDFFKASIICVVGNGENTFWSDPWLDGESLANLMPQLVEAMLARLQQRSTMASALAGSTWIQDIKWGAISIPVLTQYLHLR
jgi:hypothetical protein